MATTTRREFLFAAGAAGLSRCVRAATSTGSLPFDQDAALRNLQEHRIERIEEWRSADRYPRSVGRNAFGKPVGRGWGRQFRTIVTNQGARGWGMSWVAEDKVKHLIGARISDLFDLKSGSAESARHVDTPLHDLVGRILDLPVYKLIGAAGPQQVPMYSGAIYFDDMEPPDKPRGIAGVLASCQQDYDAGYRAFKLKIGRGFKWMPGKPGIRRDVEVTRAVRQRFPDCKVLVDANNGYTCDDFIGYLSDVADCDLYWIEEPFKENRAELLRLREHMAKVGCKAMIAEGEHSQGTADKPWRYGEYLHEHVERLYALAKEDLVHVFLLDLGMGFTRWRNVMPELAKAGVYASPHTWGGTPRSYYAAHLAAGAGNVCIVEGIPGTASGLDYSAYRRVDGKLVMPDLPGFGLERTRG